MSDHKHIDLKCDQLLGLLSDYLDGQTDNGLRLEIESHIADCQNCRVVVDTTRKTITLVHACNDKPFTIPEDVRDRLYKRLDLDTYLNNPKEAA
jgi:anti-sigma factor RsiW